MFMCQLPANSRQEMVPGKKTEGRGLSVNVL